MAVVTGTQGMGTLLARALSLFLITGLTWTSQRAESPREPQGLCGGTGLGLLGTFNSLSKGEFGNTFHSAHFAGRGQCSLPALVAAQRGVHGAELVTTWHTQQQLLWVEDRAGSEGTVPKWLDCWGSPRQWLAELWALVLTSFSEAPG